MAERRNRGNQRRKKKKKSLLFAPISFLVICAAMVFGMSVFFNVSVIEVSGNSTYSESEIVEASGIEEGDNLFFINRSSATSSVFSKLPYIENVSITRKLPNKLLIEVTEITAIAYAPFEAGSYLTDKNCKVLGLAEQGETDDLIRLEGIMTESSLSGEQLNIGPDSELITEYLSAILSQISMREMSEDIDWIDISNIGNPIFEYMGKFTVKLGKNEDLDYKFELLSKAVAQLKEGDTGIIDLSNDKKAQFLPE